MVCNLTDQSSRDNARHAADHTEPRTGWSLSVFRPVATARNLKSHFLTLLVNADVGGAVLFRQLPYWLLPNIFCERVAIPHSRSRWVCSFVGFDQCRRFPRSLRQLHECS